MADPEKIRIMARLSIMEKHNAALLRDTENSFRIDRITNPVWLNAIRMTAVYLIALMIWAVSHMDYVLDLFAEEALNSLIFQALVVYLVLLAFTAGISLLISLSGFRKEQEEAEEYRELLLQLWEMESRT